MLSFICVAYVSLHFNITFYAIKTEISIEILLYILFFDSLIFSHVYSRYI